MESDSGEEEMAGPQNLYTILLVILIFFITGLLGILLCHILQEKGYRCRTSQQLDVEQNTPAATTDDVQESNQDTVGQIVQCILDNKANAEALKEMLKEHEEMQPLSHSPIFPEKIARLPLSQPHHHTVHSGLVRENHSVCLHCSQRKKGAADQTHLQPRGAEGCGPKMEVTVFSVGRFRVTHMDRGRAADEQNSIPTDQPSGGTHSEGPVTGEGQQVAAAE
ncbi:RELT-like protein 2 isoform X2 [Narcine bancroftii]